MNARMESRPGPVKNRTTVERKSDREVVVTRTINGPARTVFEAFTKAELFKRWWVPKSMGMTLLSCDLDARVGGKYRLVFDHGGPEPAAFFGTYVEVKPYSRLAWTNEEGGEGGPVTTVTFEEKGGKTLVVLHESYPSKEALDAAGTGAADAMGETFDQLDELLVALGESSGQEQRRGSRGRCSDSPGSHWPGPSGATVRSLIYPDVSAWAPSDAPRISCGQSSPRYAQTYVRLVLESPAPRRNSGPLRPVGCTRGLGGSLGRQSWSRECAQPNQAYCDEFDPNKY